MENLKTLSVSGEVAEQTIKETIVGNHTIIGNCCLLINFVLYISWNRVVEIFQVTKHFQNILAN